MSPTQQNAKRRVLVAGPARVRWPPAFTDLPVLSAGSAPDGWRHSAHLIRESLRAIAVTSRAAGNTVSPAIAALFTLAGVATGQPVMAVAAVLAGALAGSLTEEAVGLVASVWRDRQERIQDFARAAEDEADRSIEDLLAEAMKDAKVRELLARSVETAARSLDDWKIDLLAATFVGGLRDDALVDDVLLLVEAIRQLETPHMRVLTVLAKERPLAIAPPTADVASRLECRGPTVDRGRSGSVRTCYVKTKVWRAASTHWPRSCKDSDSSSSTVPGVSRYETYYELSRLGRGCVNYLVERERSVRLRQAER